MRLIDSDALIEFIDMGHLRNPLESCFSERDVVDMLESRPTTDAVPVVRCRNCKHSEFTFFVDNGTIRIEKYKCGNHLGMGMAQEVNADDFCSYGERKEGAE